MQLVPEARQNFIELYFLAALVRVRMFKAQSHILAVLQKYKPRKQH
jgi:hypothetical protein